MEKRPGIPIFRGRDSDLAGKPKGTSPREHGIFSPRGDCHWCQQEFRAPPVENPVEKGAGQGGKSAFFGGPIQLTADNQGMASPLKSTWWSSLHGLHRSRPAPRDGREPPQARPDPHRQQRGRTRPPPSPTSSPSAPPRPTSPHPSTSNRERASKQGRNHGAGGRIHRFLFPFAKEPQNSAN